MASLSINPSDVGGYRVSHVLDMAENKITSTITLQSPDPDKRGGSLQTFSSTSSSVGKNATELKKQLEAYLKQLDEEGKPYPPPSSSYKRLDLPKLPPLPKVEFGPQWATRDQIYVNPSLFQEVAD